MDIREELDKYNDYIVELKGIDKDVADYRLKEITISGSNFTVNGDIRPKGYMSSNLENKVINIVDKIKELKIRREKIQAHVNYLDGLINNTLDELEKKVIELKYKNNCNFTEISKKIYRARSNVYDIHDRAIEKMDEKLKKRQK